MALHNDQQQTASGASLRWITVPNALSITRLFLAPVVVWLILAGSHQALVLALVLMLIAEITDYLDGFLARSLNQESEIGRLIDPVCDVVYHVSVFLAFVKQGWMAPWMLFVIYSRDLAVPYIRTLARQRSVDVGVRFSGKLKTTVHGVVQLAVICVALGYLPLAFGADISTMQFALLTATVMSVISLADYAVAAFRPR